MTVSVKLHTKGRTIQGLCKVDGLENSDGTMKTLTFSSGEGPNEMKIRVPPELVPFITKGDGVYVAVTFVKTIAEVENENALILPGDPQYKELN